MEKHIKYIAVILILALSLSACNIPGVPDGVYGVSSTSQDTIKQIEELANEKPINENETLHKVEVLKIGKNTTEKEVFSYIGIVKSDKEVTLDSRGEGVVSKIFVKEGEKIKEGDIIASLKDANGDNSTQINHQIAENNLANAKDALNNIQDKTSKSIKANEIILSQAQQSLADTKIQLDKVKGQNKIVLKNSQLQLQNANNSLIRLKDSLGITQNQLNINDTNLIQSVNISLENVYSTLELALYSTIPSIISTLKSIDSSNKPDRFENDMEDLQDDLDDVRSRDIDDLANVTEDLIDFILDVLTYVEEDIKETHPSEATTIQSSLGGLQAQLIGQKSSLTASENSLDALSIGHTAQEKIVLDQVSSIEDQINLQENSVELSTAQADLAEYSLVTAINNLNKQIESSKNALDLAKIGTTIEIEGQENQIETLTLQLKQSSLMESYLNITSTVDGVISNILIEEGQLAYNRAPVVKVFTNDKNIEVFIDPKDINKIKPNLPVEISLRKDENIFTGKVTTIYPIADPTNHLIKTIISIDKPTDFLIPNVIVNIDIAVKEISSDKIYIPLKSILIREDGNFVFLLKDNNTAKKVTVKIGKLLGKKVEILNGLKKGDNLIIEGNRTLKDGEKVTQN